jgi:myosin heavy subunit
MLRRADAGQLLTNVFRMLIKCRVFNRAKKGTIRLQARIRGRNVRRVLAATKIQTYKRMHSSRKKFRMFYKAIVSLQCATRTRIAKKFFLELKKEQKDVGKLKQNNEKLKQEMASLRAMLAAQAKESAASEEHKKAIAEKEKQIMDLEKRIAKLEGDLAAARATIKTLEEQGESMKEKNVADQDMIQQLRRRGSVYHSPNLAPESPKGHRKRMSSTNISASMTGAMMANIASGLNTSGHERSIPEGMPANYVSPEILAEHRSRVARLEEELEHERRSRRDADGEIIRLRAEVNGVKLDDEQIRALLATQVSSGVVSEDSSFAGDDARYVTI